jgi:hypothetical protein
LCRAVSLPSVLIIFNVTSFCFISLFVPFSGDTEHRLSYSAWSSRSPEGFSSFMKLAESSFIVRDGNPSPYSARYRVSNRAVRCRSVHVE